MFHVPLLVGLDEFQCGSVLRLGSEYQVKHFSYVFISCFKDCVFVLFACFPIRLFGVFLFSFCNIKVTLLNLWGFHNMHPSSVYLPATPHYPNSIASPSHETKH